MQNFALTIKKLGQLKFSYDKDSTLQKIDILKHFAHPQSFHSINNLGQLHDLLLFLKAYPDNPLVENLTIQAIKNLSDFTLENNDKPLIKKQLINSGIANSEIEASFQYDILKIFINRYVFFIGFDSFGAKEEEIFSVFNMLITDTEQSAFTDENFDITEWISESFSSDPKKKLAEIISLIDENLLNEKQKTEFFSKLNVYIHAKLNSAFSRTFLSLPSDLFIKDYYENKGLEKKPDITKIINNPLPTPINPEPAEKKRLIEIAQIQLFCLLRELDAISYAEEQSVEVFMLAKGYSLTLYYQKKHKRSAIESLIGFMGFKNGVPYSYGAFWILGHSAKVALNIFEYFRGSESNYWFSQIMRVLKNYFKISHIIIEPYQFGKNNEEALSSGAFWFYYKLGFRHQDIALKTSADKEFVKLTKNKSYRSSKKMLEKFTESSLELKLNNDHSVFLNTSDIALQVSKLIQEKFNGNRIHIENKTTKELLEALDIKILSSITTLPETESFKKTSIIYYCIVDVIQQWEYEDKEKLFKLMILKLAGSEKTYIHQFQSHYKLISALHQMITLSKNKKLK